GGVVPGQPQQPNYGKTLNEAINGNRLQAFGLRSGKMTWELGGKSDKSDKKDAPDFSDTYFLGAPLPMHGKLYVLTEKNQDLRLLCLEAATGEVSWSQTLAATQHRLSQDIYRRFQAVHLAYGEGVLVCPTNQGAILGVDLLTHSLVWAVPYREKGQLTPQEEQLIRQGQMPPPPGWNGGKGNPGLTEWKVTAPIIQDSKVVFAAPDAGGLFCLNLKDGSLLWKVNRGDDDLYLAGVFKGKVVIVSKDKCRALNLEDGKQAWSVETGVPSGQGVASDNVYYLPLRSPASGPDKGPAVWSIDLNKGEVAARTKSRKQEVAGNLLFYEGDVVSQTVDEVACFPQLKIKLTQMNELLQKNPNDPVGLTDRGELHLDKGEHKEAVADLLLALEKSPPPDTLKKARTKLYETLT